MSSSSAACRSSSATTPSPCRSTRPAQVTVDSSLHSHGQGHETTFAQIVAERLGVPLDDVRVRFGDTQSAPYGMGTFASRSAVLGGGAAWKAADAVRDTLHEDRRPRDGSERRTISWWTRA